MAAASQANYSITPDKFFNREQRSKLLRVTREKAELDLLKGRKTWPIPSIETGLL